MSQLSTFDQNIAEAMHYWRWIDIKGCLKQNEYFSEKKKTDAEYNPTQKYCLVWDVMTSLSRRGAVIILSMKQPGQMQASQTCMVGS